MTFPHISYTYLAENRAKFYANKCMKCIENPTDFLHVRNPNVCLVILAKVST